MMMLVLAKSEWAVVAGSAFFISSISSTCQNRFRGGSYRGVLNDLIFCARTAVFPKASALFTLHARLRRHRSFIPCTIALTTGGFARLATS